jgi:hypothetical protein
LTIETLGASAATLFYKADREQMLYSYLQSITNTSLKENWTECEVVTDEGVIHLNKRQWAPGNAVAVTVLKVYNFLKNRFGEPVRSDYRVENLLNCDYSIGILFEPNLAPSDKRTQLLENISKAALAVVFDGETLLSSSLEPLDPSFKL